MGIGCYTLSGDNYPHRIPLYNDAERLRIFRKSAIKGMIADGEYNIERFNIIHQYQLQSKDADSQNIIEYPWYESYLRNVPRDCRNIWGRRRKLISLRFRIL